MKKDIRELLKEALSKKTCIDYAVAAVIETPSGEYILGWNGPPEGVEHTRCLMSQKLDLHDLYLCPAVHAERRAISHAAKDGIVTKGATMYLTAKGFPILFSCSDCTKSIIEAGIGTVVLPDEVYLDKSRHILMPSLQNAPYNFEMAEEHLRKTGVKIIIDQLIRIKK